MRVVKVGRGVLWRRTRGFGRFLAVCTMPKPLLDGLEMICGRDVDPLVTEVAENALCIKLADVGVLSKEVVALFEGIDVLAVAEERVRKAMKEKGKDLHFLGKTRFAMGVPGNGAIGRVWAETDPLVTRGAEDTVGFELSDVGI